MPKVCIKELKSTGSFSSFFLAKEFYWPKGPLIQILCGNSALFQKHVPNLAHFKSFLGESLSPDLSPGLVVLHRLKTIRN
jgi:hypothetical protein